MDDIAFEWEINSTMYSVWLTNTKMLTVPPLFMVRDGSPALLKAITRFFPKVDRQRCIAHKLRNILATLPKDVASSILLEIKAV